MKKEKLNKKICCFIDTEILNDISEIEMNEYEMLIEEKQICYSRIKSMSKEEILNSDLELHNAEIKFFLERDLSKEQKNKLNEFKKEISRVV